ncbi:MAG: site-2 protease family protein [Candidatus Shapirobacteria bacterium]|nr:site-2 protease family protein [Candidatus Shapirobacteria bacterium]
MINIVSLIALIALIITITIHEFFHALIADKLGDPTPRAAGRLSLNPLVHADPIGTILLPLLSAFTGIPTIGWAKPVPIDPFNLRNPKRDEILISLAGPVSNFLFAIIIATIANIFNIQSIFVYILVLINISLGIFNLIPIPPLDGSHILLNLLPNESKYQWEEALNRYGFILLIIFVFLPIGGRTLLSTIISPIIQFIFSLLLPGYLGL